MSRAFSGLHPNLSQHCLKISILNILQNDVDHEALRKDLEEHLATWSNTRSDVSKIEAEAVERWRKYERLTSPLAQQLCEQLRLVLEPTLASKLM